MAWPVTAFALTARSNCLQGMEWKGAHHFAHHSETRKATLEICYMVIMYKLAEQIVSERKRIHVPSYYGIFKETDLEFVDVKIDGRYERKDKQPDIIATTKEGKQYLIELIFKYKVQHNKAIDYNNLSCLEIDLSDQKSGNSLRFLAKLQRKQKMGEQRELFWGDRGKIYQGRQEHSSSGLQ